MAQQTQQMRCAGGSISYCHTEESAEYPKYIDENGTKRCCLCHGRGPIYEPESTAIMFAKDVAEMIKKQPSFRHGKRF